YSYTYSGDINNDGSFLNDLIYVPTDGEIDQMTFAGSDEAAQRSALKAYIANDEYLNGRRGEYAEKYGNTSPWYSRWDMRLMQEYGFSDGRSVQLSLDILNLGNLISSKWGVREVATFTGLAQPIGVSVTDGEPTYSFDPDLTSTFFNDFGLASRWQMQVGLRVNF
ncbi:MAG: TonB-dependent receptor, partial [Bacteroidota bacterium]